MTLELDFLKRPIYEVNAESFLSDLPIIQKRFPDLRIFGGNITREGIDTFSRWASETEGTELSELFLSMSHSADIESATMAAVSVLLFGNRQRILSAEKEIDNLALRRGGIRNDREFNTVHNRIMDKMDQGKPDTARMIVYEYSDQQS